MGARRRRLKSSAAARPCTLACCEWRAAAPGLKPLRLLRARPDRPLDTVTGRRAATLVWFALPPCAPRICRVAPICYLEFERNCGVERATIQFGRLGDCVVGWGIVGSKFSFWRFASRRLQLPYASCGFSLLKNNVRGRDSILM